MNFIQKFQIIFILLMIQISYGMSFPLIRQSNSIYHVDLFNIPQKYNVGINRSVQALQTELIDDQQDYIVTALGNKHHGHQYDSDYRVKQIIYNNYLLLFSKKIYL